MKLISDITADIQTPGEHKRMLGIFPCIDSRGHLAEVLYAYAYEVPGQRGRYFAHRHLGTAPASTRIGEYRTARQAMDACLYANGFGGRMPNRIPGSQD